MAAILTTLQQKFNRLVSLERTEQSTLPFQQNHAPQKPTCRCQTARNSPRRLGTHQPHNTPSFAEDVEGVNIPMDQVTMGTVRRSRWTVLLVGWSGTSKGCVGNQKKVSTNRSAANGTREQARIFAARVYSKDPRRRTDRSGKVNRRNKANTRATPALLITPTSGREHLTSTCSIPILFNQIENEWLERDETHRWELDVAHPRSEHKHEK